MAIRKIIRLDGTKTIHTQYGEFANGSAVLEENAYIKVERVNADKNAAVATVFFTIPQGVFTKYFKFDVALDGANFIAQAYEHLKTLPEFVGAEDC